jgi:hypothetical protein
MEVKEMMLARSEGRHTVDCRAGRKLGCDKVEQELLIQNCSKGGREITAKEEKKAMDGYIF